MALNPERRRFWRDTIKSREGEEHRTRVRKWGELRKRYRADGWNIKGLSEDTIFRIPRMYKLVRETIASLAYRYPHIFLKAEEDPADEESGQTLGDASTILEDFSNDAQEIMNLKPVARQLIFDGLFCGRFFAKFGYVTVDGDQVDALANGLLPYVASDQLEGDFTYVTRVPPECALPDPLATPENFYSSSDFIEVMYAPIDDLIADRRFKSIETQLRGIRNKVGNVKATTPVMGKTDDEWEDMDESRRMLLREAHRLRGLQKLYEITDRRNQRRIVFIHGIEDEAEDVPHPFLSEQVVSRPDPVTGKPLLALANPDTGTAGTRVRKLWLVEGGLPYYTGAFDVADDFWPDPKMAYENPIQNALTKCVSRRMDLLNRFKRHPVIKKSEYEENEMHIKNVLGSGEDGEALVLNDPNSIKELNWGNTSPDQNRLEQDLLQYEADTLRTSANVSQEKLATGKALAAADAELNREFDQTPIEDFFVWAVRNTFKVLSDDRFTPKDMLLRLTSEHGEQRVRLALKSWHLRGRFNISVAAGSMNVLYEQLQQDKAIQFYDRAVNSPNFDRLKLDKYLARAHGNVDAESLLKDDANVDAAKAAALEVELMIAFAMNEYDPGVTQGEDHSTHISLQGPEQVQEHAGFAKLADMAKQSVLNIAAQHVQQHQDMQVQEGGGVVRGGGGGSSGPTDLLGQVQSNAQKTQDTLSKQMEG